MCELCDIIPDKYKRGRIMLKKFFVLHEEVIDVFAKNKIFPQYKNFYFILLVSVFLVQWNVGRLKIVVSEIMHKIYKKAKNDYAEKISKATGIEI